jgi:hypothetical protein
MNLGIGTVAAQFLSWEYLFRIFVIVPLQCTYTKRQAIQHGCLPSWLGDGDKEIEMVYGEEKIFCTGPARAVKAEQKSLVPARQAQRSNQGRTPFICTL